ARDGAGTDGKGLCQLGAGKAGPVGLIQKFNELFCPHGGFLVSVLIIFPLFGQVDFILWRTKLNNSRVSLCRLHSHSVSECSLCLVVFFGGAKRTVCALDFSAVQCYAESGDPDSEYPILLSGNLTAKEQR